MPAKVEQVQEAVVAPNGELESKSVRLLKLIRAALPSDKTASVVGLSIDLTDLSKEVGMSDPELNHFLQIQSGLILRTTRASKFGTHAEFRFGLGYEQTQDVLETIDMSIPRRVNHIIRPQKKIYRGPK